jgi:hypothetical protein
MNKKNEKKNLIKGCITKEECSYMCDDKEFDCDKCSNFEECYMTVKMRCDEDFVVESVNCGGYNNAEEFWEQLFN